MLSWFVQAAEQARIRSDVKGDVVKQLLPLVDSFELARGQLQPQTDGETKIDSAYQVRSYTAVDQSCPMIGVSPRESCQHQHLPG